MNWRKYQWFLLFVIAFAVCVGSRRMLDLRERDQGRPALKAGPSSLYGVFIFGAFKPIFIEQLWSQTEKMEREGRLWELLDAQERLLRLVPDEARVWFRQAALLSFTVGQNESEDRLRWRWYRRALAIAETAGQLHPRDYDLAELRFRIVFQLVANDPYAARQIVPGTGERGLLAALKLVRELREKFPSVSAAHFSYLRAVEESVEYLMNRGRFAEAKAVLDELRADLFGQAWPFPGEPLRPELSRVFAFASEALGELDEMAVWGPDSSELVDESALQSLLQRLADLLAAPGALDLGGAAETFDQSLVALIHVRAFNLCQSLLVAKKHEAALRLLPALNRIAALAEGRVDSEMPYYSTAYVEGFRALLVLDEELMIARRLGMDSAAELFQRWRKQLTELDRLMRARAGRTDSLAKRLLDSRR